MDRQAAFNKVWECLKQQGERSHGPDGCQFRVEKNGRVLKCAIGCLIPDEKYDPRLEISGSIEALTAGGLIEFEPTLEDRDFLGALLNAHDSADDPVGFWDECSQNLKRVADRFELTLPEAR